MPRARHISSTVLPSAWPASTWRSRPTICSGVYAFPFVVVLSRPSRAVSDSHTTWTSCWGAGQPEVAGRLESLIVSRHPAAWPPWDCQNATTAWLGPDGDEFKRVLEGKAAAAADYDLGGLPL